MSNHTRGPWIQKNGFIYRDTADRYETAPIARALADLEEIPVQEMEANARLIEAAPEMLEEIKRALSNLHLLATGKLHPERAYGFILYGLEKAIAKAEGKS